MNPYDFVHLGLHALGGEIQGKTKLQKSMYFLGILADCVEELGYRPHFYGPYSEDVADAVDELRGLGFVDRSVASGGAVDPSGFEVARFDFRLNDEGKQIAKTKAAKNPALWRKIQRAVERFRAVQTRDYVKLSIAAKTYFMLGERKGTADVKELAALAGKFGWSVSPEQVNEAAGILRKLGLVSAE
jgi:uncharacterized protein YwgA